MKTPFWILGAAVLLTAFLPAGEPTEVREWLSAKGQKMTARAMSFEDGVVVMERADGTSVDVSLDLLSEADQKFIETHFAEMEEAAPEPVAPKRGPKGKKKRGPATSVLGPEPSTGGSSYVSFVPETAPTDGTATALFWTGGGRPAKASDLQKFVPAAKLTGTVLIGCGNSSNSGKENGQHIHNNFMHATEKHLVDRERVFFAGTSGGAGRAFRNTEHYKAAGTIPVVGYLPDGCRPPRDGFYYLIAGSFDYNRYASAHAAKKLGSKATLRFFPGGHTTTTPEILGDGLIWVYTMHLYEEGEQAEQQQFEERFYSYLTEGLAETPWRAYYWTDHLINTCKISGLNKGKFDALHQKLAQDQANQIYFQGRVDLTKFGLRSFTSFGAHSVQKHTTKGLVSGAERLAKEYMGVPEIETIASQLGRKTAPF